MKKLNNPFVEIENYQCFGCSPDNKNGLRLNFHEDGEYIRAEWNPEEHFQGWIDVLHGGIQATLLDEIAGWVVFVKLKTSGVTSRMNIRLRKAVYVNKGPLKLSAKLIELKRNIAFIETKLFDNEGQLCAEGEIQYFAHDEKTAKEKMQYPDHEKFINE